MTAAAASAGPDHRVEGRWRGRAYLVSLFALGALVVNGTAWAGTGSITGDTLSWIALGANENTDGGIVYGAGPGAPTTYQIGDRAGTTAAPGCSAFFFGFSQGLNCGPGSVVKHINVELGPGGDHLGMMPGSDRSTSAPSLIFGRLPQPPPPTLLSTTIDLGPGNDCGFGSSVADTIVLGDGEDCFQAGRGDDLYIQGDLPGAHDPRDPLALGTSGADAMDPDPTTGGDADNDWVSYEGRTEPITVTAGPGPTPDDGEATEGDYANVESAIGGDAGDVLIGEAQHANHFVGMGGDDRIDIRHDGPADSAACDGGTDTVIADDLGEVDGDCERVDLPGTPETTIDSGPAEGSTTEGNDATFSFFASERGSRFECRLNEGSFAPCVAPYETGSLPSGVNTFEVRATDAAAGDDESPDSDQTPAARTFTVPKDSTAPHPPTIDASDPPSPANYNEPSILGTAEGGSTVRLYASGDCSGFPLATGSSQDFGFPGLTISVADDTTTPLSATATDAAGNGSACSAAHEYAEDSTAVTPTIDGSEPDSPGNDAEPEIKGTAEPGASVELYASADCAGEPVATGSAGEFASPGFTVQVSEDATSVFSARIIDAAGNVSACSSPFEYVEDSTPPDTVIDSGPGGRVTTGDVELTFHSTEDGSTFECDLDGTGFEPCDAPKPYSGLADGEHTFQVRATDAAGNTDPSPASRTFMVDTRPACTIAGTEGNDELVGTQGGDVICALAGDDTLNGKGGGDTLVAGPGADTAVGGSGDDVIDVRDGSGGDAANCGAGADTVIADVAGADTISRSCESVEFA